MDHVWRQRSSLMSRFPTPATIDEAPAASRPMLRAAEARFGRLPNLVRLLSVSPAALQGYLALLAALDQGTLGVQTSERVALAVTEANGCQYSLSLHVHQARNRVGLDDAEITANRSGASNDLTADAAIRFAAKLAETPAAVATTISPLSGRRLRRRADHRDRAACRPQYPDQLRQQDRRHRPRLSPRQDKKG